MNKEQYIKQMKLVLLDVADLMEQIGVPLLPDTHRMRNAEDDHVLRIASEDNRFSFLDLPPVEVVNAAMAQRGYHRGGLVCRLWDGGGGESGKGLLSIPWIGKEWCLATGGWTDDEGLRLFASACTRNDLLAGLLNWVALLNEAASSNGWDIELVGCPTKDGRWVEFNLAEAHDLRSVYSAYGLGKTLTMN